MATVPPNPPSRSPRRLQTLLLATVVVLLTAILIVLVVNTGDDNDTGAFDDSNSASDDANLDAPPEDPQQVAHQFMQFIMVEQDPGKAEKLMCEDYQGLTPNALFEHLHDWESENNVLADASVTFENDSSQSPMTVRVDIEAAPYVVTWLYEITVEPNGDNFAVCTVKNITSE